MEYDVPDSTDWLKTPLQDLATLENALHCQVCKEFYDTPMLTSCSHTFCSKCIRTCLSADGRCPACRTADQANKLRNNWALQEIVGAFLVARPAALTVARKVRDQAESSTHLGKRKRGAGDTRNATDGERDGRTTRSRSKRIAASQASQPEDIVINDSGDDQDFEPESSPQREPDDGLVECPLGCGKRMKIEAVEPHLDRCEDERKQQASRSASHTPVGIGLGKHRGGTHTGAINVPQERLAELNYSLMNETKLRAKLKELGIPNWGGRQLMIKRHTEWVNLWNANCDSNNSRRKRELLHELDTWERTQGGRAPNINGVGSAVMRKDFDGVGWVNRNRDEFSRLIADARRTKSHSSVAAKETTQSEDPSPNEANNTDQIPTDNVASSSLPNDSVENPGPFASSVMDVDAIDPLRPPSQGNADSTLALNGSHVDHQSSAPLPDPQGHTRPPCDLPSHIAQINPSSSPGKVQKMPMFAMPQQAISDIDDGGIGGGGEGSGP